MGDSIGRWEGDTLVVETTKIRPEQGFRGSAEKLKVTERFTRIGPKQILYRFTVDDRGHIHAAVQRRNRDERDG